MRTSPRPLRHRSRVAALLVAAVFGVPSVLAAQTTTVDFGTPGGFGGLQCLVGGAPITFPGPISGLLFNGLRTALVGGGCVASNSGLTTTAFVTSAMAGGTFSFRSAEFAGAFSMTDVQLVGSLGGATVFTQTLAGLPNGQTSTSLFTNTSLGAIDRLQITAVGASAADQPFIVDNFTFAPAGAAVVPEPTTVVLLGAALAMTVPLVRRRRRGPAT